MLDGCYDNLLNFKRKGKWIPRKNKFNFYSVYIKTSETLSKSASVSWIYVLLFLVDMWSRYQQADESAFSDPLNFIRGFVLRFCPIVYWFYLTKCWSCLTLKAIPMICFRVHISTMSWRTDAPNRFFRRKLFSNISSPILNMQNCYRKYLLPQK